MILFSGCYFHAGECQSALGESPAGQLACVTCMNRTIRVSRALRVLCGCGGSYRRKHKAYHLQTTKHRKWEEKTAESEPQKEREREGVPRKISWRQWSSMFAWQPPGSYPRIKNNILYDGVTLLKSSRWNFLGGVGGVVQEKICLEEIYMLSSELVESLGAFLSAKKSCARF